MKRLLPAAEITIIFILSLIPVFASFPYRINIFLAWEGAYRMYQGQIPYRDFGMPLGYMFWVIPAVFFKIFGPQLITLVKAQAFINILSGFAFLSILRSLAVQPIIRLTGVLIFCLSYSFLNYWPWYNHTVIVYELIGLAFLFKYFFPLKGGRSYWWLVLSGIFTFFSFFTKQDAGGLALIMSLVITAALCFREKQWLPLMIFLASVVLTGFLMIFPFTKFSFGYWFNHGQPPHSSRISFPDILREFLAGSEWIKLYLFLILLLLIVRFRTFKDFISDRIQFTFTLLTLGILAEAAILQVTSYVPENNNIFFHSFAIVYLLSQLAALLPVNMNSRKIGIVVIAGALLWWSASYWKYVDRFILKPEKSEEGSMSYQGYTYANTVNHHTFMIELDTTDIPLNKWRTVGLKSFEKVLMPGETADGVERLMKMDAMKSKNPKVLNMSELTPLAAEVPFALERGEYYPLWFHRGVCLFDNEMNMFTRRIRNGYYDVVLFEYIPFLNNFYPFQIREELMKNYRRVDTFPAPRKPSSHAWVEVYVPNDQLPAPATDSIPPKAR